MQFRSICIPYQALQYIVFLNGNALPSIVRVFLVTVVVVVVVVVALL